MLLRVIGVETTGLPTDAGGAAICEAGFCDVIARDGVAAVQGLPAARYVDPGRPIPVTARAIHHIGDVDVRGALPAEAVAQALMPSAPDNHDFFFVAHNADFERHFLGTEARWLCTYKIALRLWPDCPSHSNQVLRYYLDLDVDPLLAAPPHRAGPDAYVTAHIIVRAINENRATIEQMHRWSEGPALLPRVNFGKHRGSSWDDVSSDYLEWVVNKSDLGRDEKANAKHHLKKRQVTA